jgi:hypothetical protein
MPKKTSRSLPVVTWMTESRDMAAQATMRALRPRFNALHDTVTLMARTQMIVALTTSENHLSAP